MKPKELFDAPKKEMTLVEELRSKSFVEGDLRSRAADRIAELEALSLVEELRYQERYVHGLVRPTMHRAADRIEELEHRVTIEFRIEHFTTDELLAEIKRRVK